MLFLEIFIYYVLEISLFLTILALSGSSDTEDIKYSKVCIAIYTIFVIFGIILNIPVFNIFLISVSSIAFFYVLMIIDSSGILNENIPPILSLPMPAALPFILKFILHL